MTEFRSSGEFEKYLVDLCAAGFGKRLAGTAYCKAAFLQNADRGDIVLGGAGVKGTRVADAQKLGQGQGRDSSAPECLSEPVGNLRFAVPQEASDRTRNLAVPEDGLIHAGGVGENSLPMRHERIAVGGIAWHECGHAVRFRIVLLLEENGEVAFGEISQDNGVGQGVPPE